MKVARAKGRLKGKQPAPARRRESRPAWRVGTTLTAARRRPAVDTHAGRRRQAAAFGREERSEAGSGSAIGAASSSIPPGRRPLTALDCREQRRRDERDRARAGQPAHLAVLTTFRSCSVVDCPYPFGMAAKGGAVVLVVAWLLVGLVVWGVGVFGIARGLEDRCLHVADKNDYGASSQSASLWPPHFTCELAGPEDISASDPIKVEQQGAAFLRAGWTLGFPVAWVLIGTAARLRRPSVPVPPQPHH